ncbi:MAG: hypothetical protein OEX81_03470 [Candidatus Pacebacteria bacterium]|nr:hypothetical protein [Candidatus Paceibacterota bacterium]
MKEKTYFILSIKKILIVIGLEIGAIILHNIFYALTGIEEAFFFIIAVFIIPSYILIATLWTITCFLWKKCYSKKR